MYFNTLLLLILIIFVSCEDLKENKGNGGSDNEGVVANCKETENCMNTTEGIENGTHSVTSNITNPDDDNSKDVGHEDSTTEPDVNYSDRDGREDDITSTLQPDCDPGSLNCQRGSSKHKSKALNKCAEYSKLNCPALFGWELLEEGASTDRKRRSSKITVLIIAGGQDSLMGQFPHMVLLGYGENVSTAAWHCGGSIISPTFILTAGHCTSGLDIGSVKYIATGILKRSDLSKESKIYNVKTIIKHPEYRPPHKYHDIALLETEKSILLGPLVSIACLNVYKKDQEKQEVKEAIATGWGLTKHRGDTADILQYALLHRFPEEICAKKFPPARLLKHGYDNKTQLCYGDLEKPKDTCQGDSGGPLETLPSVNECRHTIIGVTSFGRQCGFAGEPAIYTRVSTYVPWIESVVWP